jgi:hypothetical protein
VSTLGITKLAVPSNIHITLEQSHRGSPITSGFGDCNSCHLRGFWTHWSVPVEPVIERAIPKLPLPATRRRAARDRTFQRILEVTRHKVVGVRVVSPQHWVSFTSFILSVYIHFILNTFLPTDRLSSRLHFMLRLAWYCSTVSLVPGRESDRLRPGIEAVEPSILTSVTEGKTL